MTSINGFVPFIPAQHPADKSRIDSDQARHNPLDKTAGEDAEVFDDKKAGISASDEARAQANRNRLDGNFLPSDEKTVDDAQLNAKREPIDFEIKSDGKDGWVKV
ncbi:hypothetical protein PFLU3_41480 [Pseudomonas fluorescens]|uniref:Uncharacterized protein n=1 Tax=Pseudomonas fluorescens TaxID=294 RepID=A0A0D0THV7_PSEFL|nr:hypothetical protein C4K02_3274 [Pseudomonas synxantha]KIR20415.1 hypothetical protein PFLU3_41480 [Pseudomonas fluorescens]